uniref:DNA topoisomerase 1 n=1 Tax=viral metagenome TaxID=1070528 RepID=A0A6C0I1S5_9ZZZZ
MSKHTSWKTFEHNGVMFPPAYIPNNIPILYNGQPIKLTPEQEEYACIFARYIGTDYYNKSVFKKNFFSDWKTLFPKDTPIKDIALCDFSKMRGYLDKKKEDQKLLSKEDKANIKLKKEKLSLKYKFATIDGKKQPIGNFMVEPPSIFIGRGSHPALGSIKWRVYPSDITLNLSKGVPIPIADPLSFDKNISPKLLKWNSIAHETNSFWIASWKDLITGKTKYVWLSDKSDIKASKDEAKFNIARELGKIIDKIRNKYKSDMESKDLAIRQVATAVYFIDIFALRVGNEKGEDEADTVGTVSLRVEHLQLLQNGKIQLDFLGKDSVRYINTFDVIPIVYQNLEKFIKSKSKGDNIFHAINTNDVNKYLKKFMKKLTARVFRTYNSSKLYQDVIFHASSPASSSRPNYNINKGFSNYKTTSNSSASKTKLTLSMVLKIINDANIAVAMLCNHQKNIGKGESTKDKINKIDKDSKNYKEKIKKIKDKEKSAHLALGTSKLNYIDPRITIAFLKLHKIDLNEYYNERELNKFKWATTIDKDFVF